MFSKPVVQIQAASTFDGNMKPSAFSKDEVSKTTDMTSSNVLPCHDNNQHNQRCLRKSNVVEKQ
jgi:hypothetical protein